MPNFARLRREGTWARTVADEPSSLLDPWITWTTLYTGVPQPEHGMEFLEQPPDTVRAKRLWDLADEAGLRVGVYGSVSSWPPKPVRGYFVPGSFSPDSQTYPEDLRPIQDLNLRHTRAHAPGSRAPGLSSVISSGLRLIRCGLDLGTVLATLKILAEIRRYPDRNWKKVALQPLVNLAFFRHLYKKYRPDFATFHTNHVAHYQHRFLRAMDPGAFPDPTDCEEVRRFGDAVHYGYLTADGLVGAFLDLCDREGDVVLCVASSMGQKPFIPARYDGVAPPTCRIASIERLIGLLGLEGRCEYFATMAPQWNIRIPDDDLHRRAVEHLKAARYEPLGRSMYSVQEVKDALVLTPVSYHGLGPTTRCRFPTLEGGAEFPFEELVVQADETRKSGCHDPIGMLALYGPPIRRGFAAGDLNNLDVGPTLLTILGMPVPAYMKGHVPDGIFAGEVALPAAAG